MKVKQGVALTGRNRTGPPCSVGRPTAHAPGGRPGGGCTGSVTDDRRRQTPTTFTSLALYSMAQKLAQFLYALTLPNINRFSKLFYCQNREKICNKDPTIFQLCYYTTL